MESFGRLGCALKGKKDENSRNWCTRAVMAIVQREIGELGYSDVVSVHNLEMSGDVEGGKPGKEKRDER
jgi:PP-loop superfamily ATP-utilizing enzyme